MSIHCLSVILTLAVVWTATHVLPTVTGKRLDRLILRGHMKRCMPVYNCKANHYVKVCEKNETMETCEPCEKGEVQPNIISSLDEVKDRECFRPLNLYACPTADTVHSRTPYDSVWCKKPCRCNTNKCYWGAPCLCKVRKEPCNVNEELDVDTGECKTCPEEKYKPTVGCGPCYIDDRWLHINTTSSYITTPFGHKNTTDNTRLTENTPMNENCTKYIIVTVVTVLLLIIVLVWSLIRYMYGKLTMSSTKSKRAKQESQIRSLTVDDKEDNGLLLTQTNGLGNLNKKQINDSVNKEGEPYLSCPVQVSDN